MISSGSCNNRHSLVPSLLHLAMTLATVLSTVRVISENKLNKCTTYSSFYIGSLLKGQQHTEGGKMDPRCCYVFTRKFFSTYGTPLGFSPPRPSQQKSKVTYLLLITLPRNMKKKRAQALQKMKTCDLWAKMVINGPYLYAKVWSVFIWFSHVRGAKRGWGDTASDVNIAPETKLNNTGSSINLNIKRMSKRIPPVPGMSMFCCRWSSPISSSAIFFSMLVAILSPSLVSANIKKCKVKN